MKITVDYSGKESRSVSVIEAKYIGDYAIRVKFSDYTERLVDFKPFLNKSQHPLIKKYLDEKAFAQYQIIHGNLNWNDYEMVFPVWDLYNGRIEV